MSEPDPRRLLLVSAMPQRSIDRLAEASNSGTTIVPVSVEALVAADAGTPAVVDTQGLSPSVLLAAAVRAQASPNRTLFLTEAHDSQPMTQQLADWGALRHLISGATPTRALSLTLERLCGGRRPTVADYLGSATVHHQALANAPDRIAALNLVESAIDDSKVPGRLGEVALTLAEELITNALYNAPVSDEGAPLYRHLSRASPLPHPVRPPGRFEVGCDGDTLVIGVHDGFGSLPTARLSDDLRRMVQPDGHGVVTDTGGAGLGLVMAYQSVNHLLIDVVAGRSTQVIGTIGLGGGYRHFASAGRSFNLFISEDA